MGLACRSLTAVGSGLSVAVLAISMGVPAQATTTQATTAQAATTQAATTPGWRTFFRRGSTNFSAFWAVTAINRHDAWAVGGGTAPFAEHWNGRNWRSSPLPGGLNSAVNAVSAPSANDVWTVSDQGGYILHFNGTRWAKATKRFSGFGELTGVTAFSPVNVWVFGGPRAAPGFGTWHYNGHFWKQDTAASKNGIVRASALSPSNMWAVGSSTSPLDSIVHYTGTWRREKSAVLSGLQFDGILAVSNSKSGPLPTSRRMDSGRTSCTWSATDGRGPRCRGRSPPDSIFLGRARRPMGDRRLRRLNVLGDTPLCVRPMEPHAHRIRCHVRCHADPRHHLAVGSRRGSGQDQFERRHLCLRPGRVAVRRILPASSHQASR
jgi:hypothetical protein